MNYFYRLMQVSDCATIINNNCIKCVIFSTSERCCPILMKIIKSSVHNFETGLSSFF